MPAFALQLYSTLLTVLWHSDSGASAAAASYREREQAVGETAQDLPLFGCVRGAVDPVSGEVSVACLDNAAILRTSHSPLAQ